MIPYSTQHYHVYSHSTPPVRSVVLHSDVGGMGEPEGPTIERTDDNKLIRKFRAWEWESGRVSAVCLLRWVRKTHDIRYPSYRG